MNKEEIEKAWHMKFYKEGGGIWTWKDPNPDEILAFWLSKLDAYQSSLLERIAAKKEKWRGDCICGAMAIWDEERKGGVCWGQCLGAYKIALEEIYNLIKEGKE